MKAQHTHGILLKWMGIGLGIALSLTAGTLAWVGTHSLANSIAGAGLPMIFVVSTIMFNREAST